MALAGGAGIGLAGLHRRPPTEAPPPETLPVSVRLMDAVREGVAGTVAEMVEREPGLVWVRDGEGRSTLTLALLHRHGAVAEVLRAAGYEPDLHELAFLGDWEGFGEMAGAAPGRVREPHPIGGTAMTAAALGGAGGDLWRVYGMGGDPNPPREGREETLSPLRAAFEVPDLGRAEMTAATLLSNGAEANAPEPGGDRALHAAARRGSVALVEMLLRFGADADSRDDQGATALDHAELAGREGAGHREAAQWLRRAATIPRVHDTSRRAYDASGRPYEMPDLSHLAEATRYRMVGAAHFRRETVRELLAVDPLLAHSVQTTTEGAVEACAHTGQRQIVDLLLEHGAPYSLPTAVMCGDGRRVGELLTEDPLRIHERGAHGFPLLWYPVIGGGGEAVAMAERLLAAGARVEDQHWLGTTALHWAARTGREDLARLFLEHGGRRDRVGRKFDPAGQTPGELARAGEHEALARMLG